MDDELKMKREEAGKYRGHTFPELLEHWSRKRFKQLGVVLAGLDPVAVDLAAVARRPEPAMDRTRELAWIDLDSAPATTVGDAAAVAAHLERGAVFHSAELLGAAEAVMNLAVGYAKEREQFDRPIGSFQAVKHRCADMLVDVEGMRSAVYHAAWAIGAADAEAPVAAATAKIWCSDAGVRVGGRRRRRLARRLRGHARLTHRRVAFE